MKKNTLKFRYATMGSGKSAEIISIIRNYDECGFKGLIFIPQKGLKDNEEGTVSSRNGYQASATILKDDDNIYSLVKKELDKNKDILYVIIDEAQFLSEEQVMQATDIVDYLEIDVLAYGLLTDSFMNYFPGSSMLDKWADTRQELTTVHRLCPVCGRKAIANARVVNGVVLKEGSQISLKDQDDDIKYIPLCRKCYKEGKWKKD